MKNLAILAGLGALLLFGFPASQPAAPQAKTAERSYQTNCASCHARDGSGQTTVGKSLKVQDLRLPEIQKKTDEELAEAIRKGKKNMPAFKTLTEEEVKDMVAYMRQLGRKNKKWRGQPSAR